MYIPKEKKKKIITIFILIVFSGSTVAYAFLQIFSAPTENQPQDQTQVDTTQLKFDLLLTPQQEQAYLSEDIAVVRFFYSDNEESGQANLAVEQLFTDLSGRVLLEKIDTDVYSVTLSDYNLETTPGFHIKGSRSLSLGSVPYAELRDNVCSVFFSVPETC